MEGFIRCFAFGRRTAGDCLTTPWAPFHDPRSPKLRNEWAILLRHNVNNDPITKAEQFQLIFRFAFGFSRGVLALELYFGATENSGAVRAAKRLVVTRIKENDTTYM